MEPGESRLGRMRSGNNRRQRLGGFTLVEALVAMAIFALGLAALMPLVIANVRANDSAGVRTRAVALAQEKVEEIRAMTFDGVLALVADTETVDTVYTRSWDFPATPVLVGDGNDLRRIAVSVAWDMGARGSGSVTLVTTKARY